MNYRHIYHAGNFADVLKHAALVAVLLHLRKKDKPFAVIDTHAGRGLYDIAGPEAVKTGEAEEGLLRLLCKEGLTGILAAYSNVVCGFAAGFYPGSPLIASRLLRPNDRLVAIEAQDGEYAALAQALAGVKGALAIHGDGYNELQRVMPPAERRGVILIDPPYEAEDEFERATLALIAAHRRFATGIFLLWYPVKQRSAVAAATGEILNAGVRSLLKLELDVGRRSFKAESGGERLSTTGLFVINAPFGLPAEMEVAVSYLAEHLAQGEGAHGKVESLAER